MHFTDKTRGSVLIHKEDDAGNALAGAVFTLFVDSRRSTARPARGGRYGHDEDLHHRPQR